MNVLIFEDELHNYKFLQHMLEGIMPGCNVIGPVYSIAQGKDTLAYYSGRSNMADGIDLIIADIQLNDGLSFDVLRNAPADVPIIFTTAYDEYALRAFEFNSLSYLLKPIDEEELALAVKKAMKLRGAMVDNHHELLPTTSGRQLYRERFVVKTSTGDRIIPIYNIRYIVSEQKTTYIKLLDKTSYPVDMSLETIMEQLDPASYMKVNRKFIVPLQKVSHTVHMENGKLQLFLKGDEAPEIIISRDRKREVMQWLAQ